jgi:hypothetical protein
MMTTQAMKWAQRMSGDIKIGGLSERTEAAYLRAVRQLVQFQRGSSPDELSEGEVRDDLVWLRGEHRAAPTLTGPVELCAHPAALHRLREFPTHLC